jgi:hypothetical protein
MTLALTILLVVTPLAGVFIPIRDVHGALWALWAAGLALSLACAVVLTRWLIAGFRG